MPLAWIPAFAGMTGWEDADSSFSPRVDSRLRGNDGVKVDSSGSRFFAIVQRARAKIFFAIRSAKTKSPDAAEWPYPGKVYIRKRSDPERGSPSCAAFRAAKPSRVRKPDDAPRHGATSISKIVHEGGPIETLADLKATARIWITIYTITTPCFADINPPAKHMGRICMKNAEASVIYPPPHIYSVLCDNMPICCGLMES